jgi:hypothetical protein
MCSVVFSNCSKRETVVCPECAHGMRFGLFWLVWLNVESTYADSTTPRSTKIISRPFHRPLLSQSNYRREHVHCQPWKTHP